MPQTYHHLPVVTNTTATIHIHATYTSSPPRQQHLSAAVATTSTPPLPHYTTSSPHHHHLLTTIVTPTVTSIGNTIRLCLGEQIAPR
nr:hypothetical protein [Tanacetum cinerariifolium]